MSTRWREWVRCDEIPAISSKDTERKGAVTHSGVFFFHVFYWHTSCVETAIHFFQKCLLLV
jgi:hypothetical protein